MDWVKHTYFCIYPKSDVNWRDNLSLAKMEALPYICLGQDLLILLHTLYTHILNKLHYCIPPIKPSNSWKLPERGYCCFSFFWLIWLLIPNLFGCYFYFIKIKMFPVIWTWQFSASWEVFCFVFLSFLLFFAER